MPWYQYAQEIAYDAPSGVTARNAVGQVYALSDTSFTTPLPVQELAGVPIASLTSNNDGIIPPFKVEDHKVVNWKSGPYIFELASIEGIVGDVEAAQAAALAAQAAAEDAAARSALPPQVALGNVITETPTGWASMPPSGGSGGTAIQGAPSVWPTSFPPSPHTTPVDELRRSDAVGAVVALSAPVVSMLKAADQAAARTAIGAGTGNGTSNLTLGTTSTTAMPGNKVFTAAEVTVVPTSNLPQTSVQAALDDLAGRAGGGSGGVLVVRYTSGAYPTLPATKPTGVQMVQFIGPVQPTGLPSWIGNGATQVPPLYDVVATA